LNSSVENSCAKSDLLELVAVGRITKGAKKSKKLTELKGEESVYGVMSSPSEKNLKSGKILQRFKQNSAKSRPVN